MKRFDATSITLGLVGLAAVSFAALMLSLLINDGFATKTVLETYPGTKSVCVATRYDYSVKHSVCTQHKNVPATCTKTEVVGPIFESFITTRCE